MDHRIDGYGSACPRRKAPIEPADVDPGRNPCHAAIGRRARSRGLVLDALLFALPWMSSWLEGSNALSTTSDSAISRRTAMVESRGAVPILLLPIASSDGADPAIRNLASSLTENLNDPFPVWRARGDFAPTSLGYGRGAWMSPRSGTSSGFDTS
jgi:hypothetical protein